MDTYFDTTSLVGHDLWDARLAGGTPENVTPPPAQTAPATAGLSRQAGWLNLPLETRALWVNR